MMTCPQCGRAYPDSESFCAEDGSRLEPEGGVGARATEVMGQHAGAQATQLLACPACGANVKADEQLCPYCGSALGGYAPTVSAREGEGAVRDAQEGFDGSFDGEERIPEEGGSSWRRLLAVVGYSLAALVALAVGIVVAIWVAPRPHHAVSTPSAAPSMAVAQPSAAATAPQAMLALVNNASLGVEVSGAPTPDVDAAKEQARNVFNSGKDALLEKYKQVVGVSPATDDGLWVELEINPDGKVSAVSILTSTGRNPDVDAEVAKQMLKWRFPGGGATPTTARYPIVFASSPERLAELENELAGKVAGYSPSTLAEYRMAKVAAAPSVAVMPSPSISAEAPSSPAVAVSPKAGEMPAAMPSAPAQVPTPKTARLETPRPAPAVPPPPPLRERVDQALLRDGRFAEVHASVNGSEVTLFGKVTSDADKAAAERAAWHVAGVSRVYNRIVTAVPLLTRVKEALASDRRFRRVDAYTNGNVVTLFGTVVTENDKAAAGQLVKNVQGVGGVVNNLATDTEQWRLTQQRINDRLASAGLTGVTVQVIGRLAYLNGQVSSEQDKQRAVNITESTAPVRVEMNMIRVVPKGLF
jgi:osmotically-inducible protein OsmY